MYKLPLNYFVLNARVTQGILLYKILLNYCDFDSVNSKLNLAYKGEYSIDKTLICQLKIINNDFFFISRNARISK